MEEEEQQQLLQERDGGFRVQLNSRDDETSYSSSRRSSLSELMVSSRNSCGSGEYHHGLNTKTAARSMEGDRRRPPAARRCLSEEYEMKRHVDQAVEIFPAHDKLSRLLENPTPQRMGKLSTKTKISYPYKKNWLSNNRPVQKQAAQIRSAAAKEGWISRWNAAPCVRRSSSSSSRRDLPMSTTSIAWHRHKQLGEKELPHSSSRATTVAGSMPSLFNKKEACALAPEEANALSSSSSSYGLSLRSKYSRHAADAAHGDAANTRQRERRSERGIDDSEQRRRGANDSSFFCDSSSSSSSRSQDDDFSTKWEQEIAALQAMIARTSTLLARGSNSKPTTGDGDRQQLRISGRGFSKETATSELMMAGTKVGDQEEPENNLSSFSRRLQQQGSAAAADDQSSCILLASSTLPKQGPDATGEETEISSRDQIEFWESEPSTPSSSDRQYFSPAGSQQEIEEVEVWDDDDEHELHLEDESLAAPCSKEDEEDDDKSFSSIQTVRTLETSGSSSASSNDFPAERFNLRSTNCMQLNYRNSCKEEEDTAVVDEADYDYDHDHDLDDAAVPGDWEVVEMSRDVDHRITRSAHSSCRYYNSRYLEPEDLQHYSNTSRTTNDSDDDLSMEEEHDEHNQHWHLRDKHINLMNPMYCLQLAESFGVPASSTQPTTRDFATKELAETAEAAARFKWEEEEEEAHDRLKLDDDDYNMVVIRRTANVKIHNSSTATVNSSATNLCVQQQQPQAQHSISMFESAWAESCSSMAQDDDISFATPSNTSSFHGNKSSSENSKPAQQHSSQTDCNNRLTNTTTTTMTISLNGSSSISSQLYIKGCLDEAGSNSCKEEKGSPTNSCSSSSSSSTSPICEHEFPCMMCELANNVHAAATTKCCCNNLKFFTPQQQQQQLHLGECSAAEETLDHQSCNHSDIIKKQMWHLGDHVPLYPGWHQTPPQQQQHHCTTPQNFFGSEHPTTLHGAPSVVLRKMLMSPNYYYSDSGGAIFITTHDSQIKFLVKTVCKLFKHTLTRCRVLQCWDCSPACNKDNKNNNFAGQQLEALSS
ncbi:unnamed protein product [Sphagnum compactum]